MFTKVDFMKLMQLFGFLLALIMSCNTFAQSKQITIYVPFSAGGSVDIIARIMGAQISQKMGIPVLVDNKLGAGGTIATALVAQAKPNGSVILAHHQGIVYSSALSDNLPFNLQTDLTPIATVGITPNVLVIPANSPFKNLADFIAYAKANPGRLNYGSAGVGSNGHLAMELLQSAAGIKLTHIPYKGMPQAVADVAGGQIQAVLTTIPAALPFVQGGTVRALATSGQKRSSVLPNVPTIEELGIKGFYYEPWYGFLAPAGTPDADLDKLSAIIVDAANAPEMTKKLTSDGIEVRPLTRQKFIPVFNADIKKWSEVIKVLGIKSNN
jgi:tripartite-type tricarboxylate transporter receptor subunit TctC